MWESTTIASKEGLKKLQNFSKFISGRDQTIVYVNKWTCHDIKTFITYQNGNQYNAMCLTILHLVKRNLNHHKNNRLQNTYLFLNMENDKACFLFLLVSCTWTRSSLFFFPNQPFLTCSFSFLEKSIAKILVGIDSCFTCPLKVTQFFDMGGVY